MYAKGCKSHWNALRTMVLALFGIIHTIDGYIYTLYITLRLLNAWISSFVKR